MKNTIVLAGIALAVCMTPAAVADNGVEQFNRLVISGNQAALRGDFAEAFKAAVMACK